MTFSLFVKILYNYYGLNMSSGAEFVATMFSVISNNEIMLLDETNHPTSLAEKLYNGNSSISSNIRKKFNANCVKQNLIDFLENANLTDDAKDNLLMELISNGVKETIIISDLEQKISEIFCSIVNEKQNKKNHTSSLKNDELENEFVITKWKDNDVIIPTSHFKGRKKELNELMTSIINEEKLIIISGMGGIGKTELCRKLYSTLLDEWKKGKIIPVQKLGFISYVDNLDNSILNSLKFDRINNYEEDLQNAWNILKRLSEKYKILLFIDNVTNGIEQDPSLNKLLSIHGSIFLTSRNINYNNRFKKYYIECMNYWECKDIFISILKENKIHLNSQDEKDLFYIIKKRAKLHTKTIELLANLLVSKSWTISKLKIELESKNFNISVNAGKSSLIKELAKLFNLSNIQNYSEVNILEAFSIFPYIFIENEKWIFLLSDDAELSNDDEILNRLYQFGWIERENTSFAMHPIIAEVIQYVKKPDYQNHKALINNIITLLDLSKYDLTEVISNRNYALSIANYFTDDLHFELEEAICKVEHYIANYDSALEYQNRIQKKKEKLNLKDTLEMAQTYNSIGYIYVDKGEPDEALKWYNMAKKIIDKSCDIIEFKSELYNNIAVAYYDKHDYKNAYNWHCESLHLKKEIYGKKHLEVARTYNHIANIFADTNRSYKALNLYKKALKIRIGNLPSVHTDIAATINNIGTTYRDLELYDIALEWIKKATLMYIDLYGENHPYTARAYHNLGTVYEGLSEINEAKRWFIKAYLVRSKKLGTDKSATMNTYLKLQNLYKKMEVDVLFDVWLDDIDVNTENNVFYI